MSTDLFFLHGMESSPKGTKAQLLKQHFPQCQIPELPPDLAKRDQILDGLIVNRSCLIGSSLGGLSALFFAMRSPEKVAEMILLAPAVGFYDESIFSQDDKERIAKTVIPPNIKTTVFAALKDDVIPLNSIKSLIERSENDSLIEYIEVDDEHSLNRFPQLLLDKAQKMVDLHCSF